MEMRDLSNLALKDNQEPRDWSVFCAPILARCCLLLRLAPMTSQRTQRSGAGGSADSVPCEAGGRWGVAEDCGVVAGSGVGGIGGAFMGGLSDGDGAAACRSILSSAHGDVTGGSHVQKVSQSHAEAEREHARESEAER